MAPFFAFPPLDVEGRPVERGFVVLGGVNTVGTYLNDLWVFDLSLVDTDVCPWIQVLDVGALEGVAGVAGATVGYDSDNREFVLGGGLEKYSGGTIVSGVSFWVATADALADGFEFAGDIPLADVTIEELSVTTGDPNRASCFDTLPGTCSDKETDPDCPCFPGPAPGECPSRVDGAPVNACTGVIVCSGNSSFTDAYSACWEDPSCLATATDVIPNGRMATVSAPGAGQALGAYDPVQNSLDLFGGTAGCGKGPCIDWSGYEAVAPYENDNSGLLRVVGWEADFKEMANRPGAVYYEDGVVDEYEVGLVPDNWPASATAGVRRGAAVVGATWSLGERGYVDSGSRLLVGGTYHQVLPPQSIWDADAADGDGDTGTPSDDGCLGAAMTRVPARIDGVWAPTPWSAWFPGASEEFWPREALAPALQKVSANSVSAEETELPQLLSPAASLAGFSTFLVAGGEDAAGVAQAKMWVVEDGNPEVQEITTGLPAMSGAGLAWDPVGQSALLFGGSSLDTVFRARAPDSPPLVSPGTWDIVDASAEWRYVGDKATGNWVFTGTYTMEASCEYFGAAPVDPNQDQAPLPCVMDQVVVHFPDGNFDGDAELEPLENARLWQDATPADGETDPVEISGRWLLDTELDGTVEGVLDQGEKVGVRHSRTWRLAQGIPDGEEMVLVVELDVQTVPLAKELHTSTRYGARNVQVGSKTDLAPCPQSTLKIMQGLAAFPGASIGAHMAPSETLPVKNIHILGYPGDDETGPDVGIGPGAEVECDADDFPGFFDRPGVAAPGLTGTCFHAAEELPTDVLGVRMLAAPGVVKVGTSNHVQVWRAACLKDGPVLDVHLGPSGAFAADQTWLEGLLGGPPPFASTTLVLMPGCTTCADSDARATTQPMQILVNNHAADGTVLADPEGIEAELAIEPTLLHEYTHLYAGWGRKFPEDRWFTEGVPMLIQITRYPDAGDDGYRLVKGHGAAVANALYGLDQPRDLRDPTLGDLAQETMYYHYAPWVIGQAVVLGAGAWGTDAEAWNQVGGLSNLLYQAGRPPYTAATSTEVNNALWKTSNQSSFPSEWVDDVAVGVPVLGITGATLVAGTLTVTVEQVMHTANATAFERQSDGTQPPAPWPVTSAVPFRIACMGTAWAGCTATEAGMVGQPDAVFGASKTVTIMGITDTAVEIALVANGRLFPGSWGAQAVSVGNNPVDPRQRKIAGTRTWFTVCAAGSLDPRCVGDVDQDGWFDADGVLFDVSGGGDCNDGRADVYPGAPDAEVDWEFPVADPEVPVYGVDRNCDGAPDPAWYNPTKLREE